MSKKKMGSLSRKSITRLAILGIILFLATGFTGGIQLYLQNIKVYQEAATSYASMLTYQIGLIDIDEILENQNGIRAIQASINKYVGSVDLNTLDEEALESAYTKIWQNTSDKVKHAYEIWSSVGNFVLGFGNICRDIKYAYVVIPTEKDLVYIWDSDVYSNTMMLPFEHVAYEGKEKEHLMSVMSGEKPEDFFTEIVKGERFGTALCQVVDKNQEIVAVAAIDISISSLTNAFLKLLLNVGVVVLLIMVVSITIYHYVVRKQIIDPIVTLTTTANDLVTNLSRETADKLEIDVHTGDEIDVLARSFEEMDSKLMTYIEENAAITAEKERIGTELSLATRIQKDMLPNMFPPFPDNKEIDLYASMNPAKEVGGDFYDYFLIDETHLGVVMADVSGKGIPAALFMMMCKIMVQNFTMALHSPGLALEKVNNQICAQTIEEMFVTVWLGVLDLETGVLTAANGGHEYPILKKPDGDFELIKDKHGPVIGGIEGIKYKEYQLQLEPGSRLFVYTDGLPEATDLNEKMFGLERTLQALNEVKDATCREVLDHVTESVNAFVGEAPQFDDTTMLCLDYYGEDRM